MAWICSECHKGEILHSIDLLSSVDEYGNIDRRVILSCSKCKFTHTYNETQSVDIGTTKMVRVVPLLDKIKSIATWRLS